MKKFAIIFLAIILLFNLCGCYAPLQMIYYPNANNVPLLEEKGEFKGTIEPTNLQLAYAIDSNIGIMLNGQDNHFWG